MEKEQSMNKEISNSARTFFALDGSARSRLSHAGFALLAVLCLALVPTSARAACGSFGGLNAKNPVRLPLLAAAQGKHQSESEPANHSIVGLWHVIYTAGGSTFNDTFDTWHSDGTEFESAYLAPGGGNVCAGVWEQTGFQSVTLHHVGWLFNPSDPTATAANSFTLDEAVAVSPDGKTYTGAFTFKVWNLDGTFAGTEVKGTISATRITVE
jgi:hypothetical protein